MTTDAELLRAHERGASYKDIAEQYGLSVDSVRGRVWRERNGLSGNDNLYRHDLGTPWKLDGDYIIIGDVQLPTTDYGFSALPLAIAKRYLRKPRKCIIAGDLLNADAFSDYDADIPTPAFEQEIDSARAFLHDYLSVFDEMYWILGNHERRVGRRTQGALKPAHLLALLTGSPRIKISHWGHCVISTSTGDWRVTHGSNYSVNQLTVADQLAQKYQQHIISHHQHHCAIGFDRYKHFVVVDNGGLFNQPDMSYVVLDDSKMPNMVNGFTMLRGGYPTLFSVSPFTNWSEWLGDIRLRKAG